MAAGTAQMATGSPSSSLEQEIPTFSDLLMQQLGLGKLFGQRNKKTEED